MRGDVSAAKAADTAHQDQQADAKAALTPGQQLPPDGYRSTTAGATGTLSTAQTALQQTVDAANQVHADHSTAVQTCVSEIHRAKDLRFVEPPGFWGRLVNSVTSWISEHADLLLAISSVLKQISAIAGMLSFIPGMAVVSAVAGGAALGIDVTVQLATDKGSWTDIALDAVSMVPGIKAAREVSSGATAARESVAVGREASAGRSVAREAEAGVDSAAGAGRAADGAGRAADGAGRAADGAGRAADGAASRSVSNRAGDAVDNAASTRTPVQDRPCVGDPIDVVTGDMVLVQTDLALPGILPLVLRRTHVSSYRWGSGFGPSWASTLDQRLEIDALGNVSFVADDCSVLYYPAAAAAHHTGPVLPSHGPRRWPLHRLADGGFRLDDPDTRRFLHFPAPDGAGLALLDAVSDRFGNRYQLFRDESGAPTDVLHSAGYRVAVSCAGLRVTGYRLVAGPKKAVAGGHLAVGFRYDGSGNLCAVVDSTGAAVRFGYDEAHRMTGWVDRNGIWYGYRYDEAGRCVRTDGRGRVLSYGFSYGPSRTTVTDSLGAVSVYEFNDRGQVVRHVDPMGGATTTLWDERDRLLVRTDATGRTTQYIRDAAGRVVRTIYPDGTESRCERNPEGLPSSVVLPDGSIRQYHFDDRGAVIALIDPTGARTSYEVGATGGVVAVVDPAGARTAVTVDPAGLPTSITDPLGGVHRFARNRAGAVVSIVDPTGRTTGYDWSDDGRLLGRTAPDDASEAWAWDGEGNLVGHVDPAGRRTSTAIGTFDLPVALIGPDGSRYTFGYDTELRLTGVQNPAGRQWTYRYDAAGRLVGETDFNGKQLDYEHDAAGRVVALQSGAGRRLRMSYDSAGQLAEIVSPEGVVSYRYDAPGRVIGASSADALVSFERDACGRVVAEVCNGRRVEIGFDERGLARSRSTPGGTCAEWEYDPVGRPARLSMSGEAVAFDRDPAGREVLRAFGSGAAVAQTHDRAGRLLSSVLSASGGVGVSGQVVRADPVSAREYRYHPDGSPQSIADGMTGELTSYSLDVAGRVAGVRSDRWSESYRYNESGQIAAADVGPAGLAAGSEEGLHYSGSLVRRAGRDRFVYDADGRMVARIRKRLSRRPLVWSFEYDSFDHLVRARTPDGASWRYRYDAFGRRISKERTDSAGNLTERIEFVWLGDRLVEQLRSAGSGAGAMEVTSWEYLPGTYTPVAQVVRRVDAMDPSVGVVAGPADGAGGADADALGGGSGGADALDEQFFAVVSDLIGTPTELVTADGRNVVWSAGRRTVWGGPASDGSPLDPDGSEMRVKRANCPLRFPGQYADDETELNYNRYRYYDHATGRYLTGDPLGLLPAPDPHAYVTNPTVWIDPLGLAPCTPDTTCTPVDLMFLGMPMVHAPRGRVTSTSSRTAGSLRKDQTVQRVLQPPCIQRTLR